MRNAIDRIVSRAYSAAMSMRSNLQERSVVEPEPIGPVPLTVVNVTVGAERPLAVTIPPPSDDGARRLAVAAAVARGQLGDRWLLHRKSHVRRIDGRDDAPHIPEFLKRRKVRVLK